MVKGNHVGARKGALTSASARKRAEGGPKLEHSPPEPLRANNHAAAATSTAISSACQSGYEGSPTYTCTSSGV